LKDQFEYDAKVYWNVDVPGRTLQMPQIIKKSGADYLMMSRFEKGLYKWYSPDGSHIVAFSPGHYADAFRPLQKNFYDAAQYIASSSLYWEKYYDRKSEGSIIPLLSDWDMSPAVDYSSIINNWSSINEIQAEDGNPIPLSLPSFKIANGTEFFSMISKKADNLEIINGERPAIWLYIHGPSHQKALKASREADILLTQAEKFATINALLDDSFKRYPQEELNKAWEAKIYPDHGWGGKNGDITDNLFYQKFLYSKNESQSILNRSLQDIASKINTDPDKGIPVIVFNSLSWNRTDNVTTEIKFDPGEAFAISFTDEQGKDIDFQISEKQLFEDGSLKRIMIHFIANEVPSIGYKTYYYANSQEKQLLQTTNVDNLENKYYKISLGKGGISSIYDKELKLELIDTSKFKAAEIFTMRSVGNGAGEFANVQQPDMEGFDKTGNYNTEWEFKENGPIYTVCQLRSPIRHAEVEIILKLYHKIKRIDFEVNLLGWEGVLFREFRFALPLNMRNGKVVYEVPYAVLEVGKNEMNGSAGERYIYPCKETRPRAIQNWIGAYDENAAVFLSSSVTVADYIDPTDNPAPYPVIQPVLLASRKSCHGEGNEYLQTGDHYFSFSLTSSQPDWKQGYKPALQANEKLLAVNDPVPYKDARLPEKLSFFGISASNVLISTIKKDEKEPSVIIRLIEMEGKDSTVTLKSFKQFESIDQTNLIEETLNSNSLKNGASLSIGHQAIETFRLK
jgi:alpha-mannosidase